MRDGLWLRVGEGMGVVRREEVLGREKMWEVVKED